MATGNSSHLPEIRLRQDQNAPAQIHGATRPRYGAYCDSGCAPNASTPRLESTLKRRYVTNEWYGLPQVAQSRSPRSATTTAPPARTPQRSRRFQARTAIAIPATRTREGYRKTIESPIHAPAENAFWRSTASAARTSAAAEYVSAMLRPA